MSTTTTLKPTNVEVPVQPLAWDGSSVAQSEIQLSVSGPTPVTAVIAQKTGGSGLVVKFTTSVAGDYTIALSGKGKPLQHSPIVVSVKAGNPNDAHVPPPPAAAKWPVVFEVDALDSAGKPLPANAQLQADVKGPESVQLSLQRTGDKIRCTFETSQMNGNYVITIKHQGSPLQRSPYELNLSAKSAAGSNTQVQHEVARLPELPKTREINFKVPAKMPNGQKVTASEVRLRAGKGPEVGCKMTVNDVDNGANLEVAMFLNKPGHYDVYITKNGEDILDSPFDVNAPQEAFN
jgi:hypothetical protein